MAAHPKFKVWLNRQLWYGGMLPEMRVEQDMRRGNLRIEGKQDGKWVPLE